MLLFSNSRIKMIRFYIHFYQNIYHRAYSSVVFNIVIIKHKHINSVKNDFYRNNQKMTLMLNKSFDFRFMSTAPLMGNGLWNLSKFFTDQCSNILNKVNSHRQQLTAKISCHLAITEYGGGMLIYSLYLKL